MSCSFDPPSLPSHWGEGVRCLAVRSFTFFPPLIREAVSLDLALPPFSLRLPSLLSAVTCQQCSGRLCLSLVSMSILITLDLLPPPSPLLLPRRLGAALDYHTQICSGASCAQGKEEMWRNPVKGSRKGTDTDSSSNLL